MIRKDYYGDWWFNDDSDDDSEPINLTELFGKGKEPKDEAEVRRLIREKEKFFRG